jgi:hypothetical protein
MTAMMKGRPWLFGLAVVCGLLSLVALWDWSCRITESSVPDRTEASAAELPAAESDNPSDYYQPNLCGPVSLYAVCRLRGIEASIDELAELAGTDRRGTAIYGIIQAAQAKGLKAQAYESSIKHLQTIKEPVIIDMPAGHFCVLHSWQNGEALLIDPPGPNRLVSASELEASWGKHVIVFE